MKNTRIAVVLMTALLGGTHVQAQDDDFRKDFENFRKGAHKDYDDFRKKALMEYSDFVRQAWKEFGAEPAVPAPKEEEILPQLAPGADKETASWFGRQMSKLKESFKSKNRKVPDELQPNSESPKTKKAEEKKPVVKAAAPTKKAPVKKTRK